MSEASVNASSNSRFRGRAVFVPLALLFLTYMMNYLDRTIVAFVAIPMKQSLAISDLQFGLLTGPLFATVYGVASFPLAYLADRNDRAAVLCALLALWSGATLACGLVTSFGQLIVARMVVAIGEAGGTPVSLALLPNYIPPNRAAASYGIFMLAPSCAVLLSAAGAEFIAANLGWRGTFVACGMTGLILAIAVKLWMQDPRFELSAARENIKIVTLVRDVLRVGYMIFSRRSARGVWIGFSLSMFFSNGLLNWGPIYLNRQFGLSPGQASMSFGLALVAGVFPGLLTGGFTADWLARRDTRWMVYFPAFAFLVATPVFALGLLTEHHQLVLIAIGIGAFAAQSGLGAMLGTFNAVVPDDIRTLAGACLFFGGAILGTGLGTFSVGLAADLWKPLLGTHSLQMALVTAVIILGSLTTLSLFRAAKYLKEDLASVV